MPTIGEKIRQMRLQRGLTQTDLASDMVTPSMISQIEGDRAKPSYALLQSMANRLGMPVEYFMHDMDEQFNLAAQMHMAEYYLLTEQPQRALEALACVDEPSSIGLSNQQYNLLKIHGLRLLGEYDQAIPLLEALREQAYRMQDQRLQFRVFKESGYIEYGLSNRIGAMHEWNKAIHLGESLSRSDEISTVQVHAQMSDILIMMDTVEQELEGCKLATEHLQKASQITEAHGNFAAIGESLIQDARNAMESDMARARTFIERAISLMECTKLVEQHILIRVRLSEDMSAKADPWTQAALATTSVDPLAFISAECTRIDKMIATGNTEAAARRVARCFEILDDYRREGYPEHTEWSMPIIELRIFEAVIRHDLGDVSSAIELLESIVDRLMPEAHKTTLTRLYAYLILWNKELGQGERMTLWTDKMEELLYEEKIIPLFVPL